MVRIAGRNTIRKHGRPHRLGGVDGVVSRTRALACTPLSAWHRDDRHPKKSQGGRCPLGRGWQNSVAAHLSDEKRPMTRSLLIEHATPAPVRYWRSLVLPVTHSTRMGFRTLPCALRVARCAYGQSVARHSRVPPQSRKTSDPAEGAGELISSNGGRWAGRRQGLDDAAGGCRSGLFSEGYGRVRAHSRGTFFGVSFTRVPRPLVVC